MPELPEVEVVRRGLADHLTGHTITAVDVRHPRAVRRHLLGPADFSDVLTGRTVTDIRRRGKYLWFALDSDDAVLAHLGMSGQFRVDAGAADHRHARVVLTLDNGDRITFCDQRMFGGLSISQRGAALPAEIAHIGADPFEEGWDPRGVARRLRGRRTTIKRALLDQNVVSGIGNIYADEALWRARVHPETPTGRMSVDRLERVLMAAHDVMRDALEAGGTSFDALYVNVHGSSGYFDRSLNVYGRTGEPCRVCGTAIRRIGVGGRGTHFCSTCQRKR